jgi:NTE family protein
MATAVRIGLVLGAGGAVGQGFHAGVLAALAEEGWDARESTMIVGTSTGAVVAGMLRAGMPPADIYARITGADLSASGRRLLEAGGGWPKFRSQRRRLRAWLHPAAPRVLGTLVRHPQRARFGTFLAALLPSGNVSAEAIATKFRQVYGRAWPHTPTWVCATDLDSADRAVFGAPGAPPVDLGTAVAASSAVPGFFSPVEIGGSRYVDGGSYSPTNADVLARRDVGLDLVVVVSSMSGGLHRRVGIDTPGRLRNHRLLRDEIGKLGRVGIRAVTFEPSPCELAVMGYDAMDAAAAVEVAERVKRTTARRLNDGDAALTPLRPALRPPTTTRARPGRVRCGRPSPR